jgi:hypothetical protein
MVIVKVQTGHRTCWVLLVGGKVSRRDPSIVWELLADVQLTRDAAIVFPVRVPVWTVLVGAAAAVDELEPEGSSARNLLR